MRQYCINNTKCTINRYNFYSFNDARIISNNGAFHKPFEHRFNKEAENNEDKSVATESDIEKHNEAKEDIKDQAPVENKKETSNNNNVKNNNLKKAYVKPQNKK